MFARNGRQVRDTNPDVIWRLFRHLCTDPAVLPDALSIHNLLHLRESVWLDSK